MGLFKLKKNKRFGEGSSAFEIKHKFDEHRKTVGRSSLKQTFNNAMDDLNGPPDKEVNKRLIIIVGILILLFLFLIDFDLSIFFS